MKLQTNKVLVICYTLIVCPCNRKSNADFRICHVSKVSRICAKPHSKVRLFEKRKVELTFLGFCCLVMYDPSDLIMWLEKKLQVENIYILTVR